MAERGQGRFWSETPRLGAIDNKDTESKCITVLPAKLWTHTGHPYLSGKVHSRRLDVQALGLVPLGLRPEGDWDPEEEYWGEEGEPLDEWAKPIVARGKRPVFEMEQVIPGADPMIRRWTRSSRLASSTQRASAARPRAFS